MNKSTSETPRLYFDGNTDTYVENAVLGVPCEGSSIGYPVSIRPCADEYENKTYLGFFLGYIAMSVDAEARADGIALRFSRYNPAIFVPDLNKVIFGYESWWGRIESPEGLKEVTDEDIGNIWYVKGLRALARDDPERFEEALEEFLEGDVA
jgi:hypothetical protein